MTLGGDRFRVKHGMTFDGECHADPDKVGIQHLIHKWIAGQARNDGERQPHPLPLSLTRRGGNPVWVTLFLLTKIFIILDIKEIL